MPLLQRNFKTNGERAGSLHVRSFSSRPYPVCTVCPLLQVQNQMRLHAIVTATLQVMQPHVPSHAISPHTLYILLCACAAPDGRAMCVVAHTWGTSVKEVTGGRSIDIVAACDVMYVREAASALITSLKALCQAGRQLDQHALSDNNSRGNDTALTKEYNSSQPCLVHVPSSQGTCVILAHGRNRFAEAEFFSAAREAGFSVQEVPQEELHPDYMADDVNVYHLHLAMPASAR